MSLAVFRHQTNLMTNPSALKASTKMICGNIFRITKCAEKKRETGWSWVSILSIGEIKIRAAGRQMCNKMTLMDDKRTPSDDAFTPINDALTPFCDVH